MVSLSQPILISPLYSYPLKSLLIRAVSSEAQDMSTGPLTACGDRYLVRDPVLHLEPSIFGVLIPEPAVEQVAQSPWASRTSSQTLSDLTWPRAGKQGGGLSELKD